MLNPQSYEQQVHGAIAQGIGYALCEEIKLEEGRILTPDLATFIIPGAMDIPDMMSISVETCETSGPYGMKGAGEVGINGPLPAIAGALAQACGIRVKTAPLTAERILEAMVEQQTACERKPS